MSTVTLERRVAALEAEVARMKQGQAIASTPQKHWWEEIRGTFKDDPVYDEAMRLGREWRESQHLEDKSIGVTNFNARLGEKPAALARCTAPL